MAKPEHIENAIKAVRNQTDLVNKLLGQTLLWPVADRIEDIGEITYDWSAEDLSAQGLEKHLLDGRVWQIQPFCTDQPWGIFLVEFARDKVYRTVLRQVLRGLVPNRRRQHQLQSWDHTNLLFICTTRDYGRFTFAHFRGEKAANAKLAMFG